MLIPENNDMRYLIFLLILLLFMPAGFTQNKSPKFEKLFVVPSAIPEISGIYIDKGKIWGINDSGNEPVLFAFDTTGTLTDSIFIEKTENKDWEELTVDKEGNIYICDFGNNLNAREDLRIFKWHPEKAWLGTLFFSYEDQEGFPPIKGKWNFDAEASFWYEDSLYIFSKNRGDDFTNLYTLGDAPGIYVAQQRGTLDLTDRMATAAALSPDQKTLAILAYEFKGQFKSTLFIFRDFTPGNFCDGKMERIKLPGRQFEAIDFWDNETLFLAAEKTPIHKAVVGKVSLKKEPEEEKKGEDEK